MLPLKKGEFKDIEIILGQIVDVIKNNMEETHYKVYLFGSWSKENALYVSDIDVAIESEINLDDKIYFDIIEDMEDVPTLRKIDLVDLNKAGPGFKNNILKYGRIIYEI